MTEEMDNIQKPRETFQPHHMPHALSENNIQFLSTQGQPKPADYYIPPYLRLNDHMVENDVPGQPLLSARGRPPTRTNSPGKALAAMNGEPGNPNDEVKDQPKRSRSPHKKLFGDNGWLSRSQSVRNMARTDENTDQSPKKTGLKQWSDKMKRRIEDIVS